jgi:ABC-type transport system substrate-binding protein
LIRLADGRTARSLCRHVRAVSSTITYQVLSLVYEGLVDFDRDLKIRPVLAESWTTRADGRQWTFKLRKGVKFHNGRALAASDVKFSLDRILDPKTAARGRGSLAIIESVQVVRSADSAGAPDRSHRPGYSSGPRAPEVPETM